MNKLVVCTISSQEKERGPNLMPAVDRYKGSHIMKAYTDANCAQAPFFILSGWLGLVEAMEEIPYYEYLLEEEHVDALAKKITEQIIAYGIEEIMLFTKLKPSWVPYVHALSIAARIAKIDLNMRQIDNEF